MFQPTNVFFRYRTVLYLKKTFVVEMLYYCNLLCYVKCSTSLLTFKAAAMSLYHIVLCLLHLLCCWFVADATCVHGIEHGLAVD